MRDQGLEKAALLEALYQRAHWPSYPYDCAALAIRKGVDIEKAEDYLLDAGRGRKAPATFRARMSKGSAPGWWCKGLR